MINFASGRTNLWLGPFIWSGTTPTALYNSFCADWALPSTVAKSRVRYLASGPLASTRMFTPPSRSSVEILISLNTTRSVKKSSPNESVSANWPGVRDQLEIFFAWVRLRPTFPRQTAPAAGASELREEKGIAISTIQASFSRVALPSQGTWNPFASASIEVSSRVPSELIRKTMKGLTLPLVPRKISSTSSFHTPPSRSVTLAFTLSISGSSSRAAM